MEFVVLPDCPPAARLAALLPAPAGTRTLRHASGRPWLVGRWADRELTVVDAGPHRLFLAGRHPADPPADLSRALAAAGPDRPVPAPLDDLLRRLPGQFHAGLSLPGRTALRGSLSTSHQVFRTTADGVTVAATGPAPLRALTRAGLDEALLAARLLLPTGAPWPVAGRGLWHGVDQLTPGHWLLVDPAGRATTRRWWTPPPADLPLAEAAPLVRRALERAVRVRLPDAGPLSADLSGGMDSTALCFLAAHLGAELVTCHVTPLDQANEDARWARLAAERLPTARHLSLPAQRPENWFDAPLATETAATAVEGPPFWANGRSHVRDLTARVAAEGSARHLVGLGGDELFGLMPANLWSLWRRHPLRSLPAVRRRRLLNRWTTSATVRALATREPFPAALRRAAADLTAPAPGLGRPDTGWLPALRLPPWATPAAVELVRGLLLDAAARSPDPWDPDRTRHQILASVLFEGTTMRQLGAALEGDGVTWEAPFLDDAVVDAALALRIEDRTSPDRFKPLLAEAVGDLVPGPVLRRGSKGEFSAEMYRGLAANRSRLLALADGSRLAEHGLLDPGAFRAALLDPGPLADLLAPLQITVACESWLRSPNAVPVTPPDRQEEPADVLPAP